MSKQTKRIFTGTAGVYYVMYQLARKHFHASCTMGNAPNIDILVSSEDGARSVAIQVKTTEHALRYRGRGDQRQPFQLQFPLGRKAGKLNRPGVIFAFVDFAISSDGNAAVYLVPSQAVCEFCKRWVDTAKMVRLHASLAWMAPYRDAWHLVSEFVGEPSAGPVESMDAEEDNE
jgi:hypothetical protein